MWYTLQVYTLVAIIVFGLTGTVLLGLTILDAARDYARALRAIRRIASGLRREPFAISRADSRNRDMNPHRAA